MHSHIYLTAIPARGSDLYWHRYSPFSVHPLWLSVCYCNTYISQTAKGYQESEETLVDIFECIGRFFQRLEIYTEVPQTTEMMDKIAQIMAEVLTILGIATRDIKQTRISEQFSAIKSPLAE